MGPKRKAGAGSSGSSSSNGTGNAAGAPTKKLKTANARPKPRPVGKAATASASATVTPSAGNAKRRSYSRLEDEDEYNREFEDSSSDHVLQDDSSWDGSDDDDAWTKRKRKKGASGKTSTPSRGGAGRGRGRGRGRAGAGRGRGGARTSPIVPIVIDDSDDDVAPSRNDLPTAPAPQEEPEAVPPSSSNVDMAPVGLTAAASPEMVDVSPALRLAVQAAQDQAARAATAAEEVPASNSRYGVLELSPDPEDEQGEVEQPQVPNKTAHSPVNGRNALEEDDELLKFLLPKVGSSTASSSATSKPRAIPGAAAISTRIGVGPPPPPLPSSSTTRVPARSPSFSARSPSISAPSQSPTTLPPRPGGTLPSPLPPRPTGTLPLPPPPPPPPQPPLTPVGRVAAMGPMVPMPMAMPIQQQPVQLFRLPPPVDYRLQLSDYARARFDRFFNGSPSEATTAIAHDATMAALHFEVNDDLLKKLRRSYSFIFQDQGGSETRLVRSLIRAAGGGCRNELSMEDDAFWTRASIILIWRAAVPALMKNTRPDTLAPFLNKAKKHANLTFMLFGSARPEVECRRSFEVVFPLTSADGSKSGGTLTLSVSGLLHSAYHADMHRAGSGSGSGSGSKTQDGSTVSSTSSLTSSSAAAPTSASSSTSAFNLWRIVSKPAPRWRVLVHPWLLDLLRHASRSAKLQRALFKAVDFDHAIESRWLRELADRVLKKVREGGGRVMEGSELNCGYAHAELPVPDDEDDDGGNTNNDDEATAAAAAWIDEGNKSMTDLVQAVDAEILASMHKVQVARWAEERYAVVLAEGGRLHRLDEEARAGVEVLRLDELRAFWSVVL